MTDLSIEVRGSDIVIRKPLAGLSITYRRTANEPLLVAIDLMRHDPSPTEVEFLVQAWKAALKKAKELGWL